MKGFTNAVFALGVLTCMPSVAQQAVTVSLDGKRECGDTCALTVSRGKRADEFYLRICRIHRIWGQVLQCDIGSASSLRNFLFRS